MSEYTREEILKLIEENGGPEGLDLSEKDLSGIDLGNETIGKELEKMKSPDPDKVPKWASMYTGNKNLIGVNLHEANIEGANLRGANLQGADLARTKLQRAILIDANLRNADLYEADLRRAKLWRADLRGVNLRRAKLQKTSFYRAKLQEADLLEAKLEEANLWLANLFNAYLTRKSLGNAILQESEDKYREHYEYDVSNLKEERREKLLKERYYHAREIYLALKSSFLNSGRYDDASWAYIKERQMEKETCHPKRARQYYSDEIPAGCSMRSLKWWRFYAKHTTKWLLDWATELSCGYGEKPLRVVLASALILALFPLLYRLSGGIAPASRQPLSCLDYFHYSFGAFTTINFPDLVPTNHTAKMLTSFEALLGISVLAMLMFTLGNRISRS
jgi:hypothetical protein